MVFHFVSAPFMNIFAEDSGLLGRFDGDATVGSLHQLFSLANQIRSALGKKAYLANNYLSLFLMGANSSHVNMAASDGTEIAAEFRRFCESLLQNQDEFKEHPLYSKALNLLLVHNQIREPQEEHTRICLFFILLADDFLKLAIRKFQEKANRRLSNAIDTVYLRELYEQIALLVGEPLMEKLNLCLKQRFLIAPLTSVFLQGLTNDLLSTLITQDLETGKLMFQLTFNDVTRT